MTDSEWLYVQASSVEGLERIYIGNINNDSGALKKTLATAS